MRNNKNKYRKKDSARLVWDRKPKRAPNPRDIEFQTAEVVIPKPQRDLDQIPLSFRDQEIGEEEIDKQKMNRLLWGDNLLVMQALLAQGYEGQVNLIYIDPPFNTDERYNFQTVLNLEKLGTVDRSIPTIERLAYVDMWSGRIDSYLDMLYPRLQLARRLLAENGSIFVHIGLEMAGYVRVLLDEIFGIQNRVNTITWQRTTAHSDPKRFGIISDQIFYYARSESRSWNPQHAPYSKEYVRSHYSNIEKSTGRSYRYDNLTNPHPGGYMYDLLGCPPPANGWRMPESKATEWMAQGRIEIPPKGKIPAFKRYLDEMPGVPLQDIWTDIPPVNSQALDYTGFETQKPVKLLERILLAASRKGDLVLDFFSGSGTTALAAEKLGRRWICSDLGKVGIQICRGRLVETGANPFLIENIGNYQREMIYLKGSRIGEMQKLILKLYGATPRNTERDLGVRKAPDGLEELVYVGYPDRPTTAKKVEELVRLAEKLDGTGFERLIVLAWDYDYNFSADLEGRKKVDKPWRVEVRPLTIPPEIYEYLKKAREEEELEPLREKIKFYETPYMRLMKPVVRDLRNGKSQVSVGLERYVVFEVPLGKEQDREKLRKIAKDNFAVLIDYWAVDWDYDGFTFKSQWQEYRGNGRRTRIVGTKATKEVPNGKKHTVAVRVVDVFGNDAAGSVEVDLR